MSFLARNRTGSALSFVAAVFLLTNPAHAQTTLKKEIYDRAELPDVELVAVCEEVTDAGRGGDGELSGSPLVRQLQDPVLDYRPQSRRLLIGSELRFESYALCRDRVFGERPGEQVRGQFHQRRPTAV